MTERYEGCSCSPYSSKSPSFKSCDCPEHMKHHSHDHGTEKFFELADEAWMELLKDKVKAHILKEKEAHLDKLAEMIAKSNGEKWKHKIAAKMECEDFKNNIKEFFSNK